MEEIWRNLVHYRWHGTHRDRTRKRRSRKRIKIRKRIKRRSRNQVVGAFFSYSRVEFFLIKPMSIRTILWRRSFPGRICSGPNSPLATRTSRPAAHWQRGALGDVEETAAVLGRVLAVPFGDVQRHRSRCAVQMVFDLAQSHSLLQER
jgi:hypothetical protein